MKSDDATSTPTRADLLAHRCTHEEFYTAVCSTAGIAYPPDDPLVKRARKALAKGDVHLNSIPLATWDRIAFPSFPALSRALKLHGDHLSLSGGVCAHKCAVRAAAQKDPAP